LGGDGERGDEIGQLSHTINGLLATVDSVLRTHREFVADTSHELRNPLLAIRTNLDLLDRVPDATGRAECLREAREQVARISRLAEDLLLLARAESGQLVEQKSVALAPLVERIAREAAQQAGGRRVEVAPAMPVEIIGDEGRLAQVLTNLTTNAVQHTPSDGTITLSVDHIDGWARLRVADTGEGIPPDDVPHVFERFYQVRRPGRGARGTGLGLAIVDHLVRAHGGSVALVSTPGEGSCFTVWLPISPPSRANAAPPAASFP
ncbi:MAG: sensor histidine kinase, partial [Dehalococcoidia bacterium]